MLCLNKNKFNLGSHFHERVAFSVHVVLLEPGCVLKFSRTVMEGHVSSY